jgi:DNA polymerase III subunit epsilon
VRALVIDTETTGLVANHTIRLDRQPEVVELYMCDLDLETGRVEDRFDGFFRPANGVQDETTKITGITWDMVSAAPTFKEKAAAIKEIVEGAPTVIAHNCSYDVEMLTIEFERLGIKVAWPPLICTVEQTMHLKGFRLSLSALHELLFGEKFDGAHRARVDVAALCRCATELYGRGLL